MAMDQDQVEQSQPVGHVRVVYLGPVAPHWEVVEVFGDSRTISEFRQRALARRREARAAKDFAASDAIRDELSAQGVEVMDGDALGWEWKL